MRSLNLFVTELVLSTSVIAGNVLVVDPNGSGFTDIPAAVAVAHDGDILLLESGNYSNFTVSKGISIIADVGQTAHVTGPVLVVSIDASRDVLLSGLQVFAAPIATGYGLNVQGCTGSVRVQSCHLQGDERRTGAWIQTSSDVAFTDTTIVGGDGVLGLASFDPNANGAIGLVLNGSNLALYDSSVHGGNGAPTTCFGGSGGDGLQVSSSYAFAAGSLFVGGHGANAQNHCYSNCKYCVCGGGDGGNGVTLLPGAGSSRSRFTSFTNDLELGPAGLSGQHVMGCCGLVSYCDGDRANPGVNISVGTGDAYEQISGTLPLFTVLQNPVREQSTVTLRFAGQPGDQVYLLASSETSFAPSLFKGVQLIPRDAQTYVAILGNVDASGVLELTRLVPELGPGVQGDVLQMQSIHRNLAGEFTLGNPVSLVILDRAF